MINYRKLIVLIIGYFVLATGIALLLFSGKGVDPASVLSTGVAAFFDDKFYIGNAIVSLFILFIVFLWDRKKITIGSFTAMIFVGPLVDIMGEFFNSFTMLNRLNSNIILNILLIFLSIFIMSLGLNIYTSSQVGCGPVDILAELLTEYSGVSYKYVRAIYDMLFVVLGYVLGGAFGIGTILMALTFGYFVSLSKESIFFRTSNFIDGKSE